MTKLKKYIPRPKYLEQVEPFIGDNLIKVFTGQRRVGKSYILYQIMDAIQEREATARLIYINKEEYEFDDIKDYKDLIAYVSKNSENAQKIHLFIDEIQDIEDFEKALRHFQNKENFDIYCTGSNSNLLSGELSTVLAGRFIQIRVFALSYPEFLSFHQAENNNESILNYIKYGGLPHLINLRNREDVYYEYLNNVFNSIVLRDIVMRYNIRNVNFLQDLIYFLVDNTGSLVSAKRISDYLKSQKINISTRLVLEYLSHLQSVFFIDRVRRAEIGGRKIFEIGEKFYFEDIGLRHALIPYRQNDIGKILENLVYHHLRFRGYNVHVGQFENSEIDFVGEKQNTKVYIQVAYLIPDEKTHQREFGNLLKIKDNFPKMVISMDEMAAGNFKGMDHWHIRKFLTDF